MESLIALVETVDDTRHLVLSPKLGFFIPEVETGGLLTPGARIGTLRVLNQRYAVRLPAEGSGRILWAVARPGHGVEYRGRLAELSAAELSASAGTVSSAEANEAGADGEIIRAPIHGIFYSRPSPGAPAFAEPGQVIRRGQTVGLIEVMKTFNPVVFEGPNVPESGVLVEAGQPLLRWRASGP